jgi:hypothetical protein
MALVNRATNKDSPGRKRGRRKKNPEDRVLSNGLLPRQWERLNKEAVKRGYVETAPYLRAIVDEYFAMEDAAIEAENEKEEQFDEQKNQTGD